MKILKPWDAKEVENVDEAHANRVQADDDDDDDDIHVDGIGDIHDDDSVHNAHVHKDDEEICDGMGDVNDNVTMRMFQ